MRRNRINDLKYTENLQKGYDILTLEQIPAQKKDYQFKAHHTDWDKMMLESKGNGFDLTRSKDSSKNNTL